MKSKSDIKPNATEYIGNGKWHYNYNISETYERGKIFFNYNQLTLNEKPTYENVVSKIIRDKYTQEEELSIINKYNSVILGVIQENVGIIETYKDFIMFIENTKEETKHNLA